MTPIVSVCVVTYNHSSFIEKCLDSILMQKTIFPFEIILGEDDSTDGTREICVKYSEKYPEKIKLFLRERKDVIYINGQATGRFNMLESIKAAKGKYIALCEGDDYWTDPNKLSYQIDYLENNPNYFGCFHDISTINKNGETTKNRSPANQFNQTSFDLPFQLQNKFILNTCSLVFRNNVKLPDWFSKFATGDYILTLLILSKGKMKYFNKMSAVYRIHSGGVTASNRIFNQSGFKESLLQRIYILDNFNDYTNKKNEHTIDKVLRPLKLIMQMNKSGFLQRTFLLCLNFSVFYKMDGSSRKSNLAFLYPRLTAAYQSITNSIKPNR